MYIVKKQSYSPYCFLPNAQVSETKRRTNSKTSSLEPAGPDRREKRAHHRAGVARDPRRPRRQQRRRRRRRRATRVPRRPRNHRRQPGFSESRDDNVRRRQQDGDGSDDGEQSKND